MSDRFVIFSLDETKQDLDTIPMFWSNDYGWGALEIATIFYAEEVDDNLPLPDGQWVKLPKYKE